MIEKYFYILITLLAVLSIAFVGCKNKPTAVADFLDEANEVTGGADLTPIGEIKGYDSYNFVNYAGNFFWSVKEYYKSGSSGEKFRYSLEIKKSGSSTIAELKGYSEGEAFTKSYTGVNKTKDNQGDKFAFGYGGNNIRFNSDKKHALLTADGLNNLKLAVSNKSN